MAVPRGRGWRTLLPTIVPEQRLIDVLGIMFHALESEGVRSLREKQMRRFASTERHVAFCPRGEG